MMNAKQYAVPSQEEQERIGYALSTGDYEYYERLKQALVEKGAFRDVKDVDKQVSDLVNRATFLDSQQKERFSVEERD